jgi:hypothetical protein
LYQETACSQCAAVFQKFSSFEHKINFKNNRAKGSKSR